MVLRHKDIEYWLDHDFAHNDGTDGSGANAS
jgi:hypothetical protein